MRKSITDRNVLFGMLAMQLGFVSRQALVQAMRTWVLNKHKTLAQILREQEAVDGEAFTLLEALVAKHLSLHDNDAAKCMEALSSIDFSVRQELEQIGDSDVKASLAQASLAPTIDETP